MAVERLRVEGDFGLLVLVFGGAGSSTGVGVDSVAAGRALVTSADEVLVRRLADWRGVGVVMVGNQMDAELGKSSRGTNFWVSRQGPRNQ
jgi:hypothetical protein